MDRMTILGTFAQLESQHFIKALLTLQERLGALKEKCLHPFCLKPFSGLSSLWEKSQLVSQHNVAPALAPGHLMPLLLSFHRCSNTPCSPLSKTAVPIPRTLSPCPPHQLIAAHHSHLHLPPPPGALSTPLMCRSDTSKFSPNTSTRYQSSHADGNYYKTEISLRVGSRSLCCYYALSERYCTGNTNYK